LLSVAPTTAPAAENEAATGAGWREGKSIMVSDAPFSSRLPAAKQKIEVGRAPSFCLKNFRAFMYHARKCI
jgi:hypothetical protein